MAPVVFTDPYRDPLMLEYDKLTLVVVKPIYGHKRILQ